LVARAGLVDELDFLHLDSLPLVPRLWKGSESKSPAGEVGIHED
jgi:hypothetical protein